MNHDHAAWLLDLDGTLYRPGPVKRMMALELVCAGWFAIPTLRRFRHQHEELRRNLHEPVESPFELQLLETARALGRDRQTVELTIRRWMFERPTKWIHQFTRHDLVSEIGDFKRGGGRLAVVSDYPATTKLAALRGLPSVDVIVANGEPGGPGRLKPYPDGYLEAARRLDVPPERCLVIGDRDDADGEAARRAGMGFRLVR